MSKHLTIGLFGFGTVGEGIYQVLQQSDWATVKKICVKQADKPRNAPLELFTTNAEALILDPEIDVIVELIDDAEAAFAIALAAYAQAKAVITANKKALAEHFEDYLSAARAANLPLLYEAAVAGSIPIIRNLEEYFDNEWLRGVVGIVNGSTNYILSRIEDGHSAEAALREAQAKGYAESDPSLDVDGWDAANKLAILLHHTYGLSQHPSKLVRQGIGRISAEDAAFAASRGLRIRLLARAEQGEAGIHALVWPHFVAPSSPLYHVREAMNGILLGSTFSEQQFLYGKGAGRFPTASAVLSDLSAFRYGYQYALKKRANPAELAEDANVTLWIRSTKPELLQEIPLRKVYETYQRSDYSFTVAEVSMAELTSNEVFQDQTIASIVWPGEQAQSLNFLPQSAA
jgi:homoserine dehydrogenase